MFYVSLNERIVSRNHWLNFIPMVVVVSSKPPREGAVGSYVSSVIRFTFFRPPTPLLIARLRVFLRNAT